MIATKRACAMSLGEFLDLLTTQHRCVLPCFPVVSPLPCSVIELARLTLMQSWCSLSPCVSKSSLTALIPPEIKLHGKEWEWHAGRCLWPLGYGGLLSLFELSNWLKILCRIYANFKRGEGRIISLLYSSCYRRWVFLQGVSVPSFQKE